MTGAMPPHATAGGIVLAGGRSSRFGAEKLAADLAGRAVLDRTIDAVVGVTGEVLVVGPGSGDRSDVRYLPDAARHEGPLAGLVVGLASTRADVAVVVGGDMPLAAPRVLALLVTRLDGDATAALLADDGEARPLPMAVRRDAALAAATAAIDAGERSLRALLARLDVVVVPAASWRAVDPEGDTLLDIDTPRDLELAHARLAARLAARRLRPGSG